VDVIRIADFACHCAANCGDWIDEGDPYDKIAAGGDRPTAYIHPGCVDRYKRLLAANQTPVRNARPSEDAMADYVEAQCERCGQDWAGRRSRDGLGDGRCPVPAHVLREGLGPIGPGETCGGRLVPVGGEPGLAATDSLPCADCGRPSGADPLTELGDGTPVWLRRAFERYRPVCPWCALKASGPDDAREATSSGQGADELLALEEKAARTPGADRMRIPDPRAALGGDPPVVDEPASRDDARNEPTPEGGGT
jgi:hypothetical protein